MCGILGYASSRGSFHVPVTELRESLKLLSHRGPDGSGEFLESGVFLGHRRLSIIDLSSAADQPFYSSDGNSLLVFNGEIYNYKELSSGLTLRTTSDTEVLLEGYLKFGRAFFERIRGIYAFGIYDKRSNELILYRDPAGIKPLYYVIQNGDLSFASEIKSLYHLFKSSLSINEDAIKAYLSLGYVPEPSTVYNEIFALQPGTLLRYHIGTNQTSKEVLYSYVFDKINQLSFEENRAETEFLLKRACERNMVADVEVNVALSGGIDSSLINYYTSRFNSGRSITVRFAENAYDESRTAADFASHLSVKHLISDVTITNQLDLLNKLLIHFDQPYGDSSLIPFYFLSKTAGGYSKVIIGGDGGDEIHNGYNSQRLFPFLSKIQSHSGGNMVSHAMKAIKTFLPTEQSRVMMKFGSLLATHSGNEMAFNMLSWFPAQLDQYPLNPFRYPVANVFKKFAGQEKPTLYGGPLIAAILFQERLKSDYLRKADMMSMINSVEYRIPMLDEDLVSFSLAIPYDQKSSLFNSKKVLRSIHAKHFPSYTSQLKKKGFSLPLDTWLGDSVLKYMESYILDKNGIVLNYITPEYVKILFRTLQEKKLLRYCSRESAYQRILILYSLQLWYLETYSGKANEFIKPISSKKMKILHVIGDLGPGGAEKMLVTAANLFVERGHKIGVALLVQQGAFADRLDRGIKVYNIHRKFKFDVNALREFSNVANQYEIVHVHLKHNIKFVYTAWVLNKFSAKIILHDHSGEVLIMGVPKTRLPFFIKNWLKSQYYIGVSHGITTWSRQEYDLQPGRSFVLPNAINGNGDVNVVQSVSPGAIMKLVLVSNFRKIKNIEFAVKLVGDMQKNGIPCSLDILGQIIDRKYFVEISKLISSLDLSLSINIRTDVSDIVPQLSNFDLAIHCSKAETGPLVILEYLSAGLPFLAINRGEVALEVSTEFSELIIDNYETDQWIDRIRLIQLGLTQYPKTLPVFFKEKFSTETYYTNLQDIYNRVI